MQHGARLGRNLFQLVAAEACAGHQVDAADSIGVELVDSISLACCY
jgi:hypothetical protein